MSGKGKAPMTPNPSKGYQASEVALHNTRGDCWVIINNNIWDVTSWLDSHPGGPQVIFQYAGRDASAAYNVQHPSDLVQVTIPGNFKGPLLPSNPFLSPPGTTPGLGTAPFLAKINPSGPSFKFNKIPESDSSSDDHPPPTGLSFTGKSGHYIDQEDFKPAHIKLPTLHPDTTTPGDPGPSGTAAGPSGTGVSHIDDNPESSQGVSHTMKSINKATNKTQKRAAEYKIRMVNSWTVADGTFDPIPQDRRQKSDVPYPSFIQHAYRARAGLSSLQLSRDAPISLSALDIAVQHLWKCMPGEARRYVYVAPPQGPSLWGPNEQAVEAMYKKMENKAYNCPVSKGSKETENQFYHDIQMRPWVIWPLWVEDEWGSDYVSVIWYSESNPKSLDRFDQLKWYTIIDPRRSAVADADGRHRPIHARMVRLANRLGTFWTRAGFNISKIETRLVLCSPMPLDEASSGERAFSAIKTIIRQIIDWHVEGMKFCKIGTIKDQSKWVSPFQERIEMTGINAWVLMASMDYNARITVEAMQPNTVVEVAANGKKKYVHAYDLSGPLQESPISANDYFLPPPHIYKAEY